MWRRLLYSVYESAIFIPSPEKSLSLGEALIRWNFTGLASPIQQ